MHVDKYGAKWDSQPDALQVEFRQIRLGKNLFEHYRNAMSLIRPADDHHRWSDLILRSFIDNDITVIIGCKDSSKTNTLSKIVVIDYLCYPNDTLWLVSTTEGRGAELRIWGCIKDFFNEARQRFDVPGNPIDYLKTITTDEVDEDREFARSLRKGIIVVPCKSGGVVSGLAPYIGIKAPRLRHCGDEVSAMNEGFLNAYSNWHGKPNFRGMMTGNFMEVDDPLGIAAEPKDGWDSFLDSGKTQEWKSQFFNANVLALDGRDSPNFDFPTEKPRFPYMINKKSLEGIRDTHGEDSWQWWTFCVGKPAKGMDIWRVMTKDFCVKNKACDDVIWDGSASLTKGYGVDPAFGGVDKCVGRYFEFGNDVGGKSILRLGPYEVIKIKPNADDPEVQIANYLSVRLKELGVPNKNCGYDSFGRGTLGFAFAKLFQSDVPVPVDSGAQPTTRPVRFDLFVTEKNGSKRLKRCYEHYIKFISEMWFSVRETIDCQQLRNLDNDTIREFQARKFSRTNDKIELETKDDFKKRSNKSPNYADCTAVCIEMARRLGFQIAKVPSKTSAGKPDAFKKLADEQKKFLDSRQLQSV